MKKFSLFKFNFGSLFYLLCCSVNCTPKKTLRLNVTSEGAPPPTGQSSGTPKCPSKMMSFNVSQSADFKEHFLNYLAKQGKIQFCLAMIGYPESTVKAERARVQSYTEYAVAGWNTLLQSHAKWPIKNVEVGFSYETTRCPNSDTVFDFSKPLEVKINWYKDQGQFERESCPAAKSCGSHVYTQRLSINSYVDEKIYVGDAIRRTNIMHEYGHILGLGDAYESSAHGPVNQPPSIMRGGVTDFTDDDKLGVLTSYEYAITGQRSCSFLGQNGVSKLKDMETLVCEPTAVAIRNHGLSTDPAQNRELMAHWEQFRVKEAESADCK